MNDRGLRYMPALDGLRAVAVVGVLLYHGDVTWAKGGYFGVDAFFVLSGFLITGLLLKESERTGRIDLKAFWARRARRLLPALALVLAFVAVYAARYATPLELHQLRRDALSTMGYVANWNQIFSHTSYFEQYGSQSALKHTWSLAIEEQFYLLWPLVVFGVLRWRGASRKALLVGTGIAAGASALLMGMLYHPGHDPSRVYYGTDTRAQSLLVGAALAIIFSLRREPFSAEVRRKLHAGALLSFVVLMVLWMRTSDQDGWQYRGGFLLMAILVAVVIASISQDDRGPLGRVLSWEPLVWIGMISYGIYLWHFPVFVFLSNDRTGLSHLPLLFVRLAVTFAVATVSFYLVEWPVVRGVVLHAWRPRVIVPAVAIVLAIGLVASTSKPLPAEFTSISSASSGTPAPPPPAPPTATGAARPMRVMLVGDSVASSLAPGLAKQAQQMHFQFWNAAVLGCGLATDVGERWFAEWRGLDPRCKVGWRTRWPLQIAQYHPDLILVLLGGQDAFDRRINGVVTKFDTAQGTALAMRDLQEATNIWTKQGAHVVFLTTPYYKLGWPQKIQVERSPLHEPWIDKWNLFERFTADRNTGKATVIDTNRYLDPQGHWTDKVNGITTRTIDKCHLSFAGADFVAQWLTPQLPALARALGARQN